MSMGVWDHWVRGRGRGSSSASNVSHFALPKVFETAKDKMFLNSTLYEPCVENGWKDALRLDGVDDSVKSALEHDLIQYLQYKSSDSTDGVLQVLSSPPALGHLLSFAHILRISFHRRPHVQDFCRQRRQTFRNLLDSDININNTTPLTVSLHIRRADSCGGDGSMETRASPLDSPAQPTNIRKCYAMSVYMEALEQVLARVTGRRPLEVYLSTYDAVSVLAEIQNNFTELYKSIAAWHVLDFDRDIFDYRGCYFPVSLQYSSS